MYEGDVAPRGEDGAEMGGDGGFAAGREAAETDDEGAGDRAWRGRREGDERGSGHMVVMAMERSSVE